MGIKRWLLIIIGFSLALVACHPNKKHYQGYVEAGTIYLAEPFSGTLKKKHIDRGQQVKKGQLLFELDPNPQAFNLSHADAEMDEATQVLMDLNKSRRAPEIDAIQAQIAQVDAQIKLAKLRLSRNKTLFKKRVVAEDALDNAKEHLIERQGVKAQYEANLALAKLGGRLNMIAAQRAKAKASKIDTLQAKWSLEQKKIYAPVDGVIFDTYYREGEFVAAAKPVASMLARVDTFIEFFVPLRRLHEVEMGQNITYVSASSSQSFPAKIAYISPKAEYVPPLIYSRDNTDKLVFRIKASVPGNNPLIFGEPVIVTLEPAHGKS
ncbi:MAG: HlyD family efflux transporter periplasmic adaptor subunit [Gammaproteobacteria bacterium]|nr:HlyD family efflux transporter periplasmic adaptor subunit [Gammaproteobacteria bacterium]